MPDIFISYAREDRAVAAVLANALEGCGWSVWWDRIIPPGKTFDEVIEAELTAARCAIVLWSKAAVASRWVREEAQEAVNRNKLVPAMLDGIAPPMGFRRIHAADLAGWCGDDNHSGWQDLKGAVGDLLGEPSRPGARTAGTQSFEGPRATGRSDFRSGPKLPRKRIPASLMALPVWQKHAIALLFGFMLFFASFVLFAPFVRDEQDYAKVLPLAVLIGVLWSLVLFANLVKSITALERSRLRNQHVVFCGLCVFAIFLFVVINGGARKEDNPIFIAVAALSGVTAAVGWWRMWRTKASLRAAE